MEELTDEDLLREVMNTVGKPGKLGEQIKCVVSVSMLTEGWDANTVTHILGVRAFGTQLLCEQVVGRGLRRMSYSTSQRHGWERCLRLSPSTPKSTACPSHSSPARVPRTIPSRDRCRRASVRWKIALPAKSLSRAWSAIAIEVPTERLDAQVHGRIQAGAIDRRHSRPRPRTRPSWANQHPHTGRSASSAASRKSRSSWQNSYLEKYFREMETATPNSPTSMFNAEVQRGSSRKSSQLRSAGWPNASLARTTPSRNCSCLLEFAHDAADRIYRAIVASRNGERAAQAHSAPIRYGRLDALCGLSTRRGNIYPTRADRCHINYVVADTESWEQKMAQALEDMDEVVCYVKNHDLGFTIPYTIEGEEAELHSRLYRPRERWARRRMIC